MATYTKNGHIHSDFYTSEYDKYDIIGRTNSKNFYESFGWTFSVNDIEDGLLYTDRTDDLITKDGKIIYIESAIKSADLWGLIRCGIDVETRKLKYLRKNQISYLNMSEELGIQNLIIPNKCLYLAQRDCGNEFKGQNGIAWSKGFVMPKHGCHRVRKKCFRKCAGWTIEDYYRIPYVFAAHYEKMNDEYIKKYKHDPIKELNKWIN